VPHLERKWNAHLSYHLSGVMHMKTHGRQPGRDEQRQALTDQFRGAEHLGKFSVGQVGIICDEAKFDDVMEVDADKLKRRNSFVAVDLVRPGCQPIPAEEILADIVQQHIIGKTNPHIVIRVGHPLSLAG
jgi:hypothetical protein